MRKPFPCKTCKTALGTRQENWFITNDGVALYQRRTINVRCSKCETLTEFRVNSQVKKSLPFKFAEVAIK